MRNGGVATVALLLLASCATSPSGPVLPAPAPEETPRSLNIVIKGIGPVSLGDKLVVRAANSRRQAVSWRIAEQDSQRATIEPLGQDSEGDQHAVLLPREPGAVEVFATVNGQSARAMLAVVNSQLLAYPLPVPSGAPVQATGSRAAEYGGVFILASKAQWDEFWTTEVGTAWLQAPTALEAPVEFTEESVIAVVFPSYMGVPVIANVDTDGDVRAVMLGVRNIGTGDPAGYLPGVINLFRVPALPAGASGRLDSLQSRDLAPRAGEASPN